MTKNVRSLSLHRNTVERRRKREKATNVAKDVEKMTRECDLRAYAVVGIGNNGEAYAVWDTGDCMPLWAFASTIHEILSTDIRNSETKDGWRPSLTVERTE